MIARMPGVAAVVVLSLGVGIGVNTAIFSWIEMLVLKPVPGVADGASFQFVEARNDAGTYPGSSWLEYRDLRERLTTFADVIAFRMVPLYVGEPERTERSYGLLVSGNYFGALGLRAAAGRLIDSSDSGLDAAPATIVISYDYWRSRFSGAPDIVGRTLRVNGQPLTIAGVAPRGFQGTIVGLDFDLWVAATLAPVVLNQSRELDDRAFRGYSVLGRRRPGTTDRGAQVNLDDVMRELGIDRPPPIGTFGLGTDPEFFNAGRDTGGWLDLTDGDFGIGFRIGLREIQPPQRLHRRVMRKSPHNVANRVGQHVSVSPSTDLDTIRLLNGLQPEVSRTR
jgi:hypothetical protein